MSWPACGHLSVINAGVFRISHVLCTCVCTEMSYCATVITRSRDEWLIAYLHSNLDAFNALRQTAWATKTSFVSTFGVLSGLGDLHDVQCSM